MAEVSRPADADHDGEMARGGSEPIGEYAVLGDGHTAALVSRRGSVDWLCFPRFDSPACFAALLGGPGRGHWLLTVPDATDVRRAYLGDSFVLQTTYTSPTGTALVTEAMPLGDGRADLVRRIECLSGSVDVLHEWVVRFGYGTIVPWVHHVEDHEGNDTIRAIAGPDSLLLRGTRLPHGAGRAHVDRFRLAEGEVVELASTWTRSWRRAPRRLPVTERLAETRQRWARWSRLCQYDGPHGEAVVRSLLVLRMLTDEETGGIVAAPTTSLPESFGGERNWDYRYCWLRDAAMTLDALLGYGYRSEATAWRDWLLRAVAGDPADLQIMYGSDGRRDLPETTLDHLAGYASSRPVRIGNAAVGQRQNDVLGGVMVALESARAAGLRETTESWSLQQHLVAELIGHWREPDHGIWEVRGSPRHFTHSKVMAWAALDRAVRAVEEHRLPGPLERWRAERAAIRLDVLKHGFDAGRGTFTQHYGSSHTDAALLQIVQVGFLPPDDPRVRGTIAAIREELEVAPGLLLRYRADRVDDGMRSGEHPFLACSFWLVDALARSGEADEADALLGRLISLGNDVGLFAEQYDPVGGRMVGNFPQALSHLALVQAAQSVERALARPTTGRAADPAPGRPPLLGG